MQLIRAKKGEVVAFDVQVTRDGEPCGSVKKLFLSIDGDDCGECEAVSLEKGVFRVLIEEGLNQGTHNVALSTEVRKGEKKAEVIGSTTIIIDG